VSTFSCISVAHFRDYYHRNARLYTRQRCNSRTIVAFAYNLSSMLLTIDIPVSHTTNPRSNTDSPLSAVFTRLPSLCGLGALRFKYTVGKRSTNCRINSPLVTLTRFPSLSFALFHIPQIPVRRVSYLFGSR